mgnify:CR=1 FL=1
MAKDTDYVLPPKNKRGGNDPEHDHASLYAYVQHDYLTRKLFGLIFVVPAAFFWDSIITALLFSQGIDAGNQAATYGFLIVDFGLVIISAVYWPYSIWRYTGSSIQRFLDSIYHIGGFWSVILRVILTMLFSWSIPVVLSPIIGPITRNWAKRNNRILGD